MTQQPSDEDFVCPVCFMLLLDPTTLNCGHTICRGCLAGWYLSSQPRRDECPTCRQKWEGYPRVNTTLRNVIERLHGKKVSERQKEMEDSSSYNLRSNLDKFEKELKQRTTVTGQAHQSAGFFCGIAVAVMAVIVIYCFGSWGNSSSSRGKENADMPVATWSTSDVAQWLNSLGWARNYSEFAELYIVDGRVLLHMETEKLMDLLNVTDPYHQNAFKLAVDSLRESGVRMPQTVWEYKALYPGRSLYLSQGLKENPRCAILFLYLFYYEDNFLPFLHTTVPRQWDEELLLSQRLPSPSWSQCLMFFVMILVFPYGMIGLFAWSLRTAHTLTHLLVMLSCFFQTIFELSFFSSCLLHGQWRQWNQFMKIHIKNMLFLLISVCIWPVLPSYICSFWFCWNIYYTPLALAKTFYQTVTGPRP